MNVNNIERFNTETSSVQEAKLPKIILESDQILQTPYIYKKPFL
ncbi:MAG: hypothetical protein ACI8WA_001456 [Polaribacter sp.]